MRVLVATNYRLTDADFSFTIDGEIVVPTSGAATGCQCGCARAHAGVLSHRGTTTTHVIDIPDLDDERLAEIIEVYGESSGFGQEFAETVFGIMRQAAEAFPVGTVLQSNATEDGIVYTAPLNSRLDDLFIDLGGDDEDFDDEVEPDAEQVAGPYESRPSVVRRVMRHAALWLVLASFGFTAVNHAVAAAPDDVTRYITAAIHALPFLAFGVMVEGLALTVRAGVSATVRHTLLALTVLAGVAVSVSYRDSALASFDTPLQAHLFALIAAIAPALVAFAALGGPQPTRSQK